MGLFSILARQYRRIFFVKLLFLSLSSPVLLAVSFALPSIILLFLLLLMIGMVFVPHSAASEQLSFIRLVQRWPSSFLFIIYWTMISSGQPYGEWIFRWKISQQSTPKKKKMKKNWIQINIDSFYSFCYTKLCSATIFIRHLPFARLGFFHLAHLPLLCLWINSLCLILFRGVFCHWNASMSRCECVEINWSFVI